MLPHISTNKLTISEKKYYTTDDPNIIGVVNVYYEEIHLDKLDRKILELEENIARFKPVSYPVGVTEEQKIAIDDFNKKGAPAIEWTEGLANLKKLKKDIT